MKRFFLASLITLAATRSVPAALVTQWDFGTGASGTLIPNIDVNGGSSASLVGGTTATFATGIGGIGFGWNTTTYAGQGSGSGTRGVLFFSSTVGFEDIVVSLDQRASGTASRWSRFEYTTDGGTNWTPHSNNGGGLSPHDTFYPFSINLGSLVSVENNSLFGFRVVSIFSPQGFDQNSTLAPFAANAAYMRANAGAVYSPSTSTVTGDYGLTGTWRFDNVTISGTAVPEPASMALVAVAGMGGLLVRLRKK